MTRPALALVAAVLLAGCADQPEAGPPPSAPSSSEPSSPSGPATSDAATSAPASPAPPVSPAPDQPGPPEVVDTIATGLEVPWGMDFLPDGTAVVTERNSGRVLLIGADRKVRAAGRVDSVSAEGEAGLLGVAVSPSYSSDHRIFLYVTTAEDNRVVRATLTDGRLGRLQPILTGIPNGFIHDGGRLLFGPDGHLYVSTGEAGEPDRAQDRDDLGGKVLRITADGRPAPGNPFGSPVWSWGHRNIQGLAFVGDRLWASEFGDSSFDELNLIEAGANYGWPEVEGEGGNGEGFVDPKITWDTDDASPSGLAATDGALWLAALRGERLWRVDVAGGRASNPRGFFVGEYGRMRTIAVAPDGQLWVTTSNRDGRGEAAAEDDRILVVKP